MREACSRCASCGQLLKSVSILLCFPTQVPPTMATLSGPGEKPSHPQTASAQLGRTAQRKAGHSKLNPQSACRSARRHGRYLTSLQVDQEVAFSWAEGDEDNVEILHEAGPPPSFYSFIVDYLQTGCRVVEVGSFLASACSTRLIGDVVHEVQSSASSFRHISACQGPLSSLRLILHKSSCCCCRHVLSIRSTISRSEESFCSWGLAALSFLCDCVRCHCWMAFWRMSASPCCR